MEESKKKSFEFIETIKSKIFKNKSKEKDEIASIDAGEGAVSSDTFVKKDLSESDKLATQAAHDAIEKEKKKKKILIFKIFKIVAIIFVIIVIFMIILKINKDNEEKEEIMKNVSTVTVMNISSEISGSGTLKPKDSYTITSLVEGNVTHVLFDTGDKVIKDQLLMTIDSSTAYRNIITASSSVVQANDAYNQAKYEYEKLVKDYEGRTYKAPIAGSLRSFSVKAGTKIKNNKEIGKIVNDKKMSLKVPFVTTDANGITSGMPVVLELQETGELLNGTVDSVAQETQSINNGALVRYVTIKCQNPGGLTTENTALAYIGNYVSVADANFQLETEETLTFNDANEIEVEKLLVSEGAYVSEGTPLFLITEETFNNIMTSKKKAYLSAKEAVTKAENSYDDCIDTYDQYFITAPIDGTVISKDAKVGDKIQKNSSGAKTLASIYDLSELSFDMDIDELDIAKIKVGQQVNVQADAFANKRFRGEITNISLVAANSNGVTNYPVTVTIKDIGELLPGMNVDGYVVLSRADSVLGIPSNALQRGNVVYVLNTSPTIKSKNYDTEGISDRVKQRVPEGFTAINVETGISNENFIEIKSGLQEGDQIYVTVSAGANNQFRGMNGMGGGMGGGMRGGMGGNMPGGMRR